METAVAYVISVGIIACGIWVVAGTIAAGSPWAWTRLLVSSRLRSDLSAFLGKSNLKVSPRNAHHDVQ